MSLQEMTSKVAQDPTERVMKNIDAIHTALKEIQSKVAEYEAEAVQGNAKWTDVSELAYIREHVRYAAGHEYDEDPK